MRLDFSRPGKPMDNPFIESFNGRLRDEHLNTQLLFSVADAQAKLLQGNGTTMRSGRIAPWGRFPLASSWPRGS